MRAYCVAIVGPEGGPKEYFDGRDYQPDFSKAKIFGESELPAARQEQGNKQRYLLSEEVQVVKLNLSADFPLSPTSDTLAG